MIARDIHAEIDNTAQGSARDGEFVQSEAARDHFSVGNKIDMQACSLFPDDIARQRRGNNGNNAVFGGIDQKTQVSEVNTENRHPRLADEARRTKHGSIPTERDHHIER